MNLLEVGKILRPHGIKGGVKVESFLEQGLKSLKHVYLSTNQTSTNITAVQKLNNDAFLVYFDAITDVEMAEKFRNQPVFIDRDEYPAFNKVYLSDLIGKPVLDENGNEIGKLVDFDDYGASIILTIKVGAVSYSLPYVDDVIKFDKDKNALVTTRQKFEDLKV